MKQVIILGGGVAGLATAIRLTRSGWCVRIFERDSDRQRIGHGFIVQEGGLASLSALGISDSEIARAGHPLTAFELFDPAGQCQFTTPLSRCMGFRRKEFIELLAGDAAHVYLPFTSQGVNAAILDGLTLGESLDAVPLEAQVTLPGLTWASHRYSQLRLPDISKTVLGGRALRDRFLSPRKFANDPTVPLVK